MIDYGLKDKVALITGANNPQGIGATTRSIALEVAKYGITVNAVAPGPTQTGWIDDDFAKDMNDMEKIYPLRTLEDGAVSEEFAQKTNY